MDTLVVSPEIGISKFENYRLVYTRENRSILSYERFHADMQLCCFDDKVIVPPCFYDYYKKTLKNKNVLCGNVNPCGHYPDSVAYNVAVAGNFAICNTRYADKRVLEYLKSADKEIIHVNQGYAKCSVCVAGDGIITADMGIFKTVRDKMPALLISHGGISLPDCEYGFIGGASGFDGRVIFAGDATKHPDFCKIENFLKDLGLEYICLPGNFTDYGTLIFL